MSLPRTLTGWVTFAGFLQIAQNQGSGKGSRARFPAGFRRGGAAVSGKETLQRERRLEKTRNLSGTVSPTVAHHRLLWQLPVGSRHSCLSIQRSGAAEEKGALAVGFPSKSATFCPCAPERVAFPSSAPVSASVKWGQGCSRSPVEALSAGLCQIQ